MHSEDERGVETIGEEDGLGLVDVLIVLAKHKWLILGLPVLAATLAAGVTLTMSNIYTATARILPPQQNQSTAAAVLGQLGNLGAAAAGAGALKNPSDLYVGMLKTRSVADPLVQRFNLHDLYEVRTADDARKQLAERTKISTGRDGIISVQVDDHDPKRAAEIANGYVEQLEKMNERLAITEASQRRLFFERQLRHQKDALASAEVELKKTQEQTGLIKLDEQGKALIEAVAQLRAQIAAKEVQIGAMRSFSTERNPDLVRAEAELGGLRQQLGKLERNTVAIDPGTFLPTGKVPEVGLAYVRKLRDVKYHETLFELVAKQYELARLDESKDASILQVLDRAVPPEKKSKPVRTVIALVVGLTALAVAILLAFMREAYERATLDPARAGQLRLLKSYVWQRSHQRM